MALARRQRVRRRWQHRHPGEVGTSQLHQHDVPSRQRRIASPEATDVASLCADTDLVDPKAFVHRSTAGRYVEPFAVCGDEVDGVLSSIEDFELGNDWRRAPVYQLPQQAASAQAGKAAKKCAEPNRIHRRPSSCSGPGSSPATTGIRFACRTLRLCSAFAASLSAQNSADGPAGAAGVAVAGGASGFTTRPIRGTRSPRASTISSPAPPESRRTRRGPARRSSRTPGRGGCRASRGTGSAGTPRGRGPR